MQTIETNTTDTANATNKVAGEGVVPEFQVREYLPPARFREFPTWVTATIAEFRHLRRKEVHREADMHTRRVFLSLTDPDGYRTSAYLTLTNEVTEILRSHPRYQEDEDEPYNVTGLDYQFTLAEQGARPVATGIKLVEETNS